jgi:hypothetical protein
MVDSPAMMDLGWITITLAAALLAAIAWIVILLRREPADHDYPKRDAASGSSDPKRPRRCVYCACDVQSRRNRCPECGRVQPIRCSHCDQIIMNGLADHGPHCPMVVGAIEFEDAVEQL